MQVSLNPHLSNTLTNILVICKFNVVLMLTITAAVGLLLAPINHGL